MSTEDREMVTSLTENVQGLGRALTFYNAQDD